MQDLCPYPHRRLASWGCQTSPARSAAKTSFAQLRAETACMCRWRLSSFWAFPKISSTRRFCRASSIFGQNAWMASFVYLSTCQALVSCACPALQLVRTALVPWHCPLKGVAAANQVCTSVARLLLDVLCWHACYIILIPANSSNTDSSARLESPLCNLSTRYASSSLFHTVVA